MTKVNFHWLAQPNWKLFQQFDAIDGNHSIIVSQKKKKLKWCAQELWILEETTLHPRRVDHQTTTTM
jgi:hypothetical protein